MVGIKFIYLGRADWQSALLNVSPAVPQGYFVIALLAGGSATAAVFIK
jgi:hypothetical protein